MSTSTKQLPLTVPTDEIATFCRRHHIRQLALFGAVLRDDFGPDSDVDVLVKFEPGADETLTLMDLVGMQLELSNLFQRNVDFVMRDGLKPLIKDEVLPGTPSNRGVGVTRITAGNMVNSTPHPD